MTYTSDRFWIANGKRFRNIWLAYEELYGTEHNVSPYLENSTFSNLQGTKIDMQHDYQKDLLHKIFETYERPCLFYSGGTDSHTIAVKTRELGYRFDKSITLLSNVNGEITGQDANFVNKHTRSFFKDDPGYIVVPNSVEYMEKVFKSQRWWEVSPKFIFSCDAHFVFNDLYDEETTYVNGKEKPHLIYHKGEWYFYFHHNNFMSTWHMPNVLFFYGVNNIMPEIAIQDARKMRDYYVSRYGTPDSTKIVVNKMMYGTDDFESFIRGNNKAMGRIPVTENCPHEVNQTVTNGCISRNAVERLYSFVQMDRLDIINSFYDGCKYVYNRYPQIDWEWPMVDTVGMVPWMLNLDTLEYHDGSLLGEMLNG